MSDIVERLLAFHPPYGWPEERSTIVEPPLNKVAADTIEALRAENARLREQLKEFGAKKYHESWPDDRRVQIWTSVGSVRRAARAAMGEME